MKATIVTIQRAKANLSGLIQRASAGEEIIIARGPKPVARLVALRDTKRKRQPGSLKGKLVVGPEFFEPLAADELAAWE